MQRCWKARGGWPRGLAGLALALALAGEAGAEPAEAKPEAPPPVALDRLLRLPEPSAEAPRERLGSATKGEWRSRFASAHAELGAAKSALAEAQKELEKVAGETAAWQIAPPGVQVASDTESPANYQLRQEVRRQREELARSERQLQELTIEADLAGVPPDWRD